jgi:hypothetical protein
MTDLGTLLEVFDDTTKQCRDVIVKKNHDYGGSPEEKQDAFKNFRMVDALGLPAEKGVLIRIMDKLSRINTFLDKGDLKNESVVDAIDDNINYLIILKCLILEKLNEVE